MRLIIQTNLTPIRRARLGVRAGFTVPTNGYDSEDRLVGFNRTSGLTQSWNLSPVGDWNSVTTNGSTETRTHGPTHELLTGAGQNVTTDVKGNITFIPASLKPTASSLTSVWDFDNRLNTADVGNNGSIDLTYKFDAIGRRVFRDDGTTATIYVQAGQQTIADYTAGTAASSPTYRYVYASYIDEPVLRYKPSASESLYYHRNQQYSVVALTNASAAIVERFAYSAYGVPTITNASGTVLPVGSVNNRYMYTGREWDSVLAQYHYRARIYDANLGRFASRDPIGYEGGWSTSEYCESRPLAQVDPEGLCCNDCVCSGLTFSPKGWKTLDLGTNGPYTGLALSYVFTVAASTKGDRGCKINTTVAGSIQYYTNGSAFDKKPFKTPIYPNILQVWWSDGSCSLPWFSSFYSNGLNCASYWEPCVGALCYLDGPGLPFNQIDRNWFLPKFFKTKYYRLCIELDLVFTATCTGGPKITFPVKSSMCVNMRNTTRLAPAAKKSDFCGIQ